MWRRRHIHRQVDTLGMYSIGKSAFSAPPALANGVKPLHEEIIKKASNHNG